MKVSLIHPSRSRSQQALRTLESWINNLSGVHEFEYILSVDADDPHLDAYVSFPVDMVVISNNTNLVQAANVGAKEASGDIFILVSDDFACFKDYDLAIVKAMKGKSGVLKTYDGVQKWIVTIPILTKDYYDEQGYLYHPDYRHQFVDTYLTHKADLLGKLYIRNDIIFIHKHYSVGGNIKDDVNTKADSTWGHGKKLYLNDCKKRFGLSGDIDIFNLSDTAKQAGHITWLKNELRKFKG